jgi:hypothetical protein
VDLKAAEHLKSKLNQVVSEYPPENQFNADKTGLFYTQMPRKSLVQKGENVKVENFARKDCVLFFKKRFYFMN